MDSTVLRRKEMEDAREISPRRSPDAKGLLVLKLLPAILMLKEDILVLWCPPPALGAVNGVTGGVVVVVLVLAGTVMVALERSLALEGGEGAVAVATPAVT